MIEHRGRGVLLDIEGTTSSISFVHDVMFPYVRRELDAFLQARWETSELTAALDQLAADAGHQDWASWQRKCPVADPRDLIRGEVARLMDADAKTTGLKQLQGLIWEAGFHNGELKAHLYDDVLPCLQAWKSAGADLRIYSSGSVQAQKLFFSHTSYGDLLPLFTAHYDTKVGAKTWRGSYAAIVEDFGLPAGEILFLSDNPVELDAAQEAGLCVGLAVRPGNLTLPSNHGFTEVYDFREVTLSAD